ncbi:FHA domain-containing protein [Lapillicoccus jejuensis]|uniref:Double zinc ribbon protein n=1 Tax=Lapillicoccus jejuensis TaxID=402171 RepID=A0A542DWS9_9MICO|nr:FHA domain-containing protein [Lapillicoccus jejuensis]TQJ07551.1 double zinc ribbon protein [Lapillicoccus jejuensis]
MICPNGHESQADDFCDTCGAPIDREHQPVGSVTSASAEPAAASSQACPHCGTTNLPDALFCEACGYDFTTGALPRGERAPGAAAEGEGDGQGVVPASSEGPDTEPDEPVAAPAPAEPVVQWVAEVWVDPAWYEGQEAEEPLPSPGLPTVVPLTKRSNLVGRVSASRNIVPDVDCTSDTGVSRRHAQLTTDGRRWFVEDLGSSNGTYVGPAAGPLPIDPIAVGPRTELSDDDRVYVGAWTRIVVREATEEERATP